MLCLTLPGQPILVLTDLHRPRFRHLGKGRYEFTVPELDAETHRTVTARLAQFGERVVLLNQTDGQP